MDGFHTYATFAIVAVTIAGYISERVAIEIVASASLAAFLALFALFPYTDASGAKLGADELVMGFANPALLTVLALLIVGQGLFATDALDKPARAVARYGGRSATLTLSLTLLAAAVLSAFLNNTPVVVIFIPVLTVLAAQRNFALGKALMPLSFLSVLGGMTTLIGSSTNLLVAGVAERYGTTVGFFDITAPGLILAAVGALYVLFVMPRFVGSRDSGKTAKAPGAGTQFIGEIVIGPDHPLAGLQSRAGLFPDLKDLTPRLIVRRGLTFYSPFEEVVLSAGDRLTVSGTRRAFMLALAGGTANTGDGPPEQEGALAQQAPGPDYHVAEAVITPGSRHAGRTVRNAGIETLHDVDLLGVQRKSRMARLAVGNIRLEPGDTLLVGADEDHLKAMRDSHELLVLEWSAEPVPQRRKAWLALLVFAAVVTTAATGMMPIVASSIIGAFAMIAVGCLTLQQAARAFERQIFLLVGASIAAAIALERTGGAALIAEAAVESMIGFGPAFVLSGLFLIVAVMTNLLSNNATAVLFTPIALDMARTIGAPPEAFIATVIFAANASFATPVGYQTNMLVMGPGRYSFADFVKAGAPLVVIIWLTFSIIGPWYYGL